MSRRRLHLCLVINSNKIAIEKRWYYDERNDDRHCCLFENWNACESSLSEKLSFKLKIQSMDMTDRGIVKIQIEQHGIKTQTSWMAFQSCR